MDAIMIMTIISLSMIAFFAGAAALWARNQTLKK